jgi:sugar (pentulose or hexulose) kinase
MLIQSSLWQDFSRLSRQLKQGNIMPDDHQRLISDYSCRCCQLATMLAQQNNSLLQEWCLRYALFTLAEGAVNQQQSAVQRQACQDMLYMPLIALTRLYQRQPQGQAELAALRAKLKHCFA